MSDLDGYYKVLGLEPGASLDEVNQAYRDLAFIWHPDRIPKDNPRLQQKAQEKLKEINQARDRLRSVRPSEKTRNPEPPPRDRAHSPSPYYQSSYSYQSPPQSSYQTPKPNSDLSGANLSGANLKEKDLSGRNLSNANLSNANLSDSFLHKVNLQGANLEKANLFRANLLQAKLNNANLREANLIGADLSGADLRGADLRGAKIGSQDRILVKLTGANLAGAILPDGSIHA
ncbi:pentapeptide repeat-containing protein [Coleofasciculus sp. FACHB-1120]|uniref:pentapeptide repeat-containing protein n=1 Tax=Coleofasciculus sp. FACHB-1120 TaxID=2692783 RepID=UPI001688F4F2|nr:pentapeptide repeat-containing protein [Coleofasciculus sp. FACHB-1120]MBD2741519.1 pentapeptide repeat-containing protein [Coleofasciculus sp. FACHB-1120]